jgi:hypothetical protein
LNKNTPRSQWERIGRERLTSEPHDDQIEIDPEIEHGQTEEVIAFGDPAPNDGGNGKETG